MAVRYSPRGTTIVGTSESLIGTARISSFNDDGTYEYAGETDVCYDASETRKNDKGERLFVDDEGNEWPESKLRKTRPRKR